MALGAGWLAAETSSGTCDPTDQLNCSCQAAGLKPGDVEYHACFLGDVNFATKTQVDRLSANAFIALNWPAAQNEAGTAISQPDIRAARSGDWTPVWTTWKSTNDIFRGNDAFRSNEPPLAWDAPQPVPAACKDVDIAAAKARFSWADQIPTARAPRLLDEYVNPDGDALLDAQGQPVRYDVIFNRQAYDYIVANKLWDAYGLETFLDAKHQLDMPKGAWPASSADTGTRGAIALKTAWKVLSPSDDPGRFHKEWAWLTPTIAKGRVRHDCDLLPVGLVGMHITYKTNLMPEWSWASFEHVDVAPTWAEVGATDAGVLASGEAVPDWLFYARNSSDAARLNTPPKDATAGVPSRIVRTYPDGYYFGPVGAQGATTGSCAPSNQEFRCISGGIGGIFHDSVFRNYALIGTQWREGKREEGGILTPEILGNATMETFTQAESSCLSCHSHAAPRGVKGPVYDFLYSFDRDVVGRSAPVQGN